jgi:hypothetical protein
VRSCPRLLTCSAAEPTHAWEPTRVMRLNFSHATTEEVELRLKNLAAAKGVNSKMGASNLRAILLDTKGPEIRMGGLQVCKSPTGAVPSENRKAKIQLQAGAKVLLSSDTAFDGTGDASTIYGDCVARQRSPCHSHMRHVPCLSPRRHDLSRRAVNYHKLAEVLQPGNSVLLDVRP